MHRYSVGLLGAVCGLTVLAIVAWLFSVEWRSSEGGLEAWNVALADAGSSLMGAAVGLLLGAFVTVSANKRVDSLLDTIQHIAPVFTPLAAQISSWKYVYYQRWNDAEAGAEEKRWHVGAVDYVVPLGRSFALIAVKFKDEDGNATKRLGIVFSSQDKVVYIDRVMDGYDDSTICIFRSRSNAGVMSGFGVGPLRKNFRGFMRVIFCVDEIAAAADIKVAGSEASKKLREYWDSRQDLS